MDHAATSLTDRIRRFASDWANSQQALVTHAAEFTNGHERALDGSPSAAHWIAAVADIEIYTARQWIRIGRKVGELHASADAFADGRLATRRSAP